MSDPVVTFTDDWGVTHRLTLEAAAKELQAWENAWPGGLEEVHSALVGYEQRIYELKSQLPSRPEVAPSYWIPWTLEETARRFHDAYEKFAPSFGYVTNLATREFDPRSPNGRLMVATVRYVLTEQAVQEYVNNPLAGTDAASTRTEEPQ